MRGCLPDSSSELSDLIWSGHCQSRKVGRHGSLSEDGNQQHGPLFWTLCSLLFSRTYKILRAVYFWQLIANDIDDIGAVTRKDAPQGEVTPGSRYLRIFVQIGTGTTDW